MNRCEVALVLSDTAFESLQKEVKAIVNPKVKEEVRQLLSSAEMFRDKETSEVLFYWHDIRWVRDVKAVFFIEAFLDWLPDEEYVFTRLGEDSNDIVELGCYPDNFDCYVLRELHLQTTAKERIKMPELA